jgi:hypothetical protein
MLAAASSSGRVVVLDVKARLLHSLLTPTLALTPNRTWP